MIPTPEFSRWPAPAKLNLFLRITGRREDGYHLLQTCFQLLDWGDEIEIAVTDNGSIERESGLADVAPEQDLAIRAARLLREHCTGPGGARIRVHKSIPAGAGLGGGSSDAATVLLALNVLWRCGLDRSRLAGLGATLGADVPVFIHGHSAWAEGIGDQLTPVELGERHYVLLFPNVHVSTTELFAAPELKRDSQWLERDEFDPEASDPRWSDNAFEPLVRRRYPAIDGAMRALQSYGHPRLTGTGSCIFLPVEDKLCADAITRRLECRYNVRSVAGIDRSPVLDERYDGC
jgi:4-diphosphocytidyl-2-C-methyl-D-erythritol kinase